MRARPISVRVLVLNDPPVVLDLNDLPVIDLNDPPVLVLNDPPVLDLNDLPLLVLNDLPARPATPSSSPRATVGWCKLKSVLNAPVFSAGK